MLVQYGKAGLGYHYGGGGDGMRFTQGVMGKGGGAVVVGRVGGSCIPGMYKRLMPPTFIDFMPSSNPGMTCNHV